MEKRFWSLGLLGILLFATAFPAMAAWKIGHGDMLIRKGEVLQGDLYFSGEYLEIEGEVKGDVLVAAGEVKVSGKIDGSLMGVISEKLAVTGIIGEDLRVVAGKMTIGGTVGESVSAVAAFTDLTSGSIINQGIIGLFQQLRLTGEVNGPVRVSGYALTLLGGTINGDVQVRGVPITWAKKTIINGNVDDYTGSNNTSAAAHAKIKGDYRMHQDTELMLKVLKVLLIFSLIWFLGSVLIALIFYKLFPRTSWRISEPNITCFRKHLLSGLLGALGIPVIIVILFITRVGIPLAVLLGLGYIILLLFSNVLLYIWIGRLIFSKSSLDMQRHPVLLIVTGGLALLMVGFIPFANYFLGIIGFGMVLSQIHPELDENRQEDIHA